MKNRTSKLPSQMNYPVPSEEERNFIMEYAREFYKRDGFFFHSEARDHFKEHSFLKERMRSRSTKGSKSQFFTTIRKKAFSLGALKLSYYEKHVGDIGTANRDTKLEDALKRLFNVRYPIVVDNGKQCPSCSDTELNTTLGRWGSNVLLALLRMNDNLGLASGRAVRSTVESCQFAEGLSFQGSLLSLCGSVSANAAGKPPVGASKSFLDSDMLVTELAIKMHCREVVGLATSIAPPKNEVKQAKELCTSNMDIVDLMITGIGSLIEGRYTEHEKYKDMVNISNDIAGLCNIVADTKTYFEWKGHKVPCCLVGDIANMFFVSSYRNVKMSKAARRVVNQSKVKAVRIVNGLLDKMVVPSLAEIRSVNSRGAVIAIAGGVEKVFTLYDLLTRTTGSLISHLITDASTAELLVELMDPKDSKINIQLE